MLLVTVLYFKEGITVGSRRWAVSAEPGTCADPTCRRGHINDDVYTSLDIDHSGISRDVTLVGIANTPHVTLTILCTCCTCTNNTITE